MDSPDVAILLAKVRKAHLANQGQRERVSNNCLRFCASVEWGHRNWMPEKTEWYTVGDTVLVFGKSVIVGQPL